MAEGTGDIVRPQLLDVGVATESQEEAALRIHGELKEIQDDPDRAKLYGFGLGSVFYNEGDGELTQVSIQHEPVHPDVAADTEIFYDVGFKDEDISSGIVAIRKYKLDTDPPPDINISRTGRFGGEIEDIVYLSGTGKVFKGLDPTDVNTPFEQTQLDDRYTDALKKINTLTKVPNEILKIFGSYEAYKRVLDSHQIATAGIDTSSRTASVESPWMIYHSVNNGLQGFVDALKAVRSRKDISAVIAPEDWHLKQSFLLGAVHNLYQERDAASTP